MFSIKDKKVIVIGGTSGIGKAIAKHFVQCGAIVSIMGRRDSGMTIAKEIGASFQACDVSDPDQVRDSIDAAVEIMHGLDVAILNSANYLVGKPILDYSIEDLHRTINVNFMGVWYGIRYCAAKMGSGSSIIVTAASPSGFLAMPGNAAFNCSKTAVNMLVKCAGLELIDRGIRVNAIQPPPTNTETLPIDSPTAKIAALLSPARQVRQPEDLVMSYQFLASDDSSTVNCTILGADDGLSAGFSSAMFEKILS